MHKLKVLISYFITKHRSFTLISIIFQAEVSAIHKHILISISHNTGYLKNRCNNSNLFIGLFYTFCLCDDFSEDQLAVKKLQSSVAVAYLAAQVALPHEETSTAVQLMLIELTLVHQLSYYLTKQNYKTILN